MSVTPLRDFTEQVERVLARLPRKQAQHLYQFLTDAANIQSLGLWVSALVASLIAVVYSLMFRWCENFIGSHLSFGHGYWWFVFTPLFFVASWYVIRRVSPEAGGSGVPQIMAAIETPYEGEGKARVDSLVSFRTIIAKILSSLFVVFGGGAMGPEGPIIQVSAALFHLIGKQVRKVVPQTNHQTWLVAGAAAGLAAALNTPLGGIVYAIEDLGAVHFHRVRTAVLSAVIVAGLVAQWLLGSYLYLGFPQLQNIAFSFLPWAILVGVIAGLAGGTFGRLLYYLAEARAQIDNMKTQVGIAIFCGLVAALFILVTPHASGSGTDMMMGFMFRGEHADFGLVLIRFAGTVIAYLTGAAGGLFSPALAIGSALGSFLSHFLGSEHNNLMVLLGMIGFLTGFTRSPFTSFILVLEMTDRHSAIFPMMLTAVVAQSAAHFVDRDGFYEHMKEHWLIKHSEAGPAPTTGPSPQVH